MDEDPEVLRDEEEQALHTLVSGGTAVAVSVLLAIASFYLENYWFDLVLVLGSLVAALIGLGLGIRERAWLTVLQSTCLAVIALVMLVSPPL